jgi:hypothetical protein
LRVPVRRRVPSVRTSTYLTALEEKISHLPNLSRVKKRSNKVKAAKRPAKGVKVKVRKLQLSTYSEVTTERAIRFSYIYESEEWKEDEIQVQIEPKPFAAGAMRNAFRMKILAEDGSVSNWVAKGYSETQIFSLTTLQLH